MQALEWLVRLKDDKLTEHERRNFSDWVEADPANAEAFKRAEALWNRFDIVKPEYERLRRKDFASRRSILLGGLAAALVAPTTYLLTRPGLFADYRTGIGERRMVVLEDGSRAELGSNSSLSVAFSAQERMLTLHEGQAFFIVASDASRPFTVRAGAGATRALGTRFDVKFADDVATVTVVEHSVSVQIPDRAAIELVAGLQVSYGRGFVEPAHAVDLAVSQAWQHDRIVFEDAPLRNVLRELERYRRGRIILMDASIGDMPVTAIFDTHRAADALSTIAGTLPVRVLDPTGLVAVVYRR